MCPKSFHKSWIEAISSAPWSRVCTHRLCLEDLGRRCSWDCSQEAEAGGLCLQIGGDLTWPSLCLSGWCFPCGRCEQSLQHYFQSRAPSYVHPYFVSIIACDSQWMTFWSSLLIKMMTLNVYFTSLQVDGNRGVTLSWSKFGLACAWKWARILGGWDNFDHVDSWVNTSCNKDHQ